MLGPPSFPIAPSNRTAEASPRAFSPPTHTPSPCQAHAIIPQVLPAVMAAAQHPSALLRHPAVYGLGIMAQFASAVVRPHVGACLGLLIKCIMAKDARCEENEACTDNAVAAAVKFARFCGDAMPAEQREGIMSHALTYFPIKGDEIEARLLHGWLVSGLMANEPLWVGSGSARLRAAVEALAKIRMAHEDNEDKDGERLIEERSEAELRGWAATVKGGPGGPQLAALVASVDAKWRPYLERCGL